MSANKVNTDICNCTVIHEDIVSKVRKRMPEEEKL